MIKWEIVEDTQGNFDIATEMDKNGDSEVIAYVEKQVGEETAKLVAAAPELARACKIIYEALMLPQRGELKYVKEVLEDAMKKAGLMDKYKVSTPLHKA